MISRIEAHNYRCFPKLAIDLDHYHALAEANGAGKSILLELQVLIDDMLRRQSPHLVDVLCYPKDYWRILQRAGFWPEGVAKPPMPEEALDHLRRPHKVLVFNAGFGKLVRATSLKNCQDLAFNQLRDQLRAWFPERQ